MGRELPEIAARLNRTEEETFAWFSRLAELAWRVGGDSLVHYRKRRGGVFPNQKGMLCRPWNLWLDGGVDETVKEVAGNLGLDLKGSLAGFKCRVPVMPVMEKEAAARQLEDRIDHGNGNALGLQLFRALQRRVHHDSAGKYRHAVSIPQHVGLSDRSAMRIARSRFPARINSTRCPSPWSLRPNTRKPRKRM